MSGIDVGEQLSFQAGEYKHLDWRIEGTITTVSLLVVSVPSIPQQLSRFGHP